MSLFDRISEQQRGTAPAAPVPQPPHSATSAPPVVEPAPLEADPFGELPEDPFSGPIEAGLPPQAPTIPTSPSMPAPLARRVDPMIGELRHRIHQLLIDELGPILFDQRFSEDELQRRVQ